MMNEPLAPGNEQKHARPHYLFPGLIGAVALVLAIPLAAAGCQPFTDWFYTIAWYGLILFLDSVRAASGRGSLIFGRPFAFIALVFWSAVLWFLFEAINFRLADWYYVFATDSRLERIISGWLSFGTVLPALFLIELWLEDMGLFKSRPVFRIRIGRSMLTRMAFIGAACLVLPMAFPRYAFPLIWAFGFLPLLPLAQKRLDRFLVYDLQEGRPGRLLRILTAGLICGIIWELLNHFARIRWSYTVPFLEDLKLFEMPPLGFLGFPPFALECTVIYGALAGFGLAPSLEGFERARQFKKPNYLIAAMAGVLALAGGMLVLRGMEQYNIDSFTPRPDRLQLPTPVKALVREGALKDCFQLRAALENPVVRAGLHSEGVAVKKVIDLLDLTLLRGIGTEHVQALAAMGVDSIGVLAGRDPGKLARALVGKSGKRALEVRESRVKVWIKAAKGYEP